MAARRHLPGVALVGACLPLAFAWLSAPSVNCHLWGGARDLCYVYGWPRPRVDGAGAAGRARRRGSRSSRPGARAAVAVRGPATRTLLAPSRGAVRALPYLPVLAGGTLLYALSRGPPSGAALPALLALTVPVIVAQAAWLAGLSRALAAAYSLASRRNSMSE